MQMAPHQRPQTTNGINTDALGGHAIPRLGIDAEGGRHYYDEANQRVLVIEDGDVSHVETGLTWSDLKGWKGYVRNRRGIAVWGGEQFEAGLEAIGETVTEMRA